MKTVLIVSSNEVFVNTFVKNKKNTYILCDIKNLERLSFDLYNVDEIVITIFPNDFFHPDVLYLYNILLTHTQITKHIILVLNNILYTTDILSFKNRHYYKNLIDILKTQDVRLYLNDIDYFTKEFNARG
jgi:hypothetical protein